LSGLLVQHYHVSLSKPVMGLAGVQVVLYTTLFYMDFEMAKKSQWLFKKYIFLELS